MPIQPHPQRDELLSFVMGMLPDGDVDQIAEHVERCADCRSTIVDLAESSDTLAEALRTDGGQEPFCDEPELRDVLQAVRKWQTAPPATETDTSANAASLESPPPVELRDYRLVAQLGRGGMGTVYRAWHTKLQRPVAIKLLDRQRMRHPQAVARFYREMAAVGRLDHPNLVRAVDAGEVDGTHFLVMDLVDGLDLSTIARRLGPLPIAEACEAVRQAALGLDYAHASGLVHRDVKPSNLMVTFDGQVKVLDLGLARLAEAESVGELTTEDQLMGTPDYMAPEQCADSHAVDVRSDIYSLGATLYRLLAGHAPFSSERYDTLIKKIAAVASEPIAPIRTKREAVPEALAALLERMLAKDPAQRPASAAEVAAAIAPFADGSNLAELVAPLREEVASEGLPPLAVDRAIDNVRPATRATADFEPSAAMPATGPRRRLPRRVMIAAASLFVIALATIVTVATHRGTLVIETTDEAVEVSVLRGGREVAIVDTKTNNTVRLWPAKYELQLADGANRLRLSAESFTITRGEQAIVRVEERRAQSPQEGGRPYHDLPSVELVESFAATLVAAGKLEEAEAEYRRVLEARRSLSGPDNPATLEAAQRLAEVLRWQNVVRKIDEAEQILRQALAATTRRYGPEHPKTLGAMWELAWTLSDLGDHRRQARYFEESEKLRRKMLDIQTAKLGAEHPETLRSAAALADLLRAGHSCSIEGYTERLDESETLLRRTLQAQRRLLGVENGDTIWTTIKLGALLQAKGKVQEAEELLRDNYEASRKGLGEYHLQTLEAGETLGDMLRSLGRHSEAEEIYRQTFEYRMKLQGRRHRDTQTAVRRLAGALAAQGKGEEAEELYRRMLRAQAESSESPVDAAQEPSGAALSLSRGTDKIAQQYIDRLNEERKRDGKESRPTISLALRLADGMAAQGKLVSAVPLYRRVLQAQKTIYGEKSSEWLQTAHQLASLLGQAQKLDEAETLATKVVAGRTELLGPEHPLTLDAQETLAHVVGSRDGAQIAEALFRELMEKRGLAQGEDDVSVLKPTVGIAYALRHQGQFAESERLFREIAQRYRDELGEDHDGTLFVTTEIGYSLRLQRKWDEAEALLRPHVGRCRKVYGDDHFRTIDALTTLAWALAHEGQSEEKLDEAERLFRTSLSAYVRLVGLDHPTTIHTLDRYTELLRMRYPGDWDRIEEVYRVLLEVEDEPLALDRSLPDTDSNSPQPARDDPIDRAAPGPPTPN